MFVFPLKVRLSFTENEERIVLTHAVVLFFSGHYEQNEEKYADIGSRDICFWSVH